MEPIRSHSPTIWILQGFLLLPPLPLLPGKGSDLDAWLRIPSEEAEREVGWLVNCPGIKESVSILWSLHVLAGFSLKSHFAQWPLSPVHQLPMSIVLPQPPLLRATCYASLLSPGEWSLLLFWPWKLFLHLAQRVLGFSSVFPTTYWHWLTLVSLHSDISHRISNSGTQRPDSRLLPKIQYTYDKNNNNNTVSPYTVRIVLYFSLVEHNLFLKDFWALIYSNYKVVYG